MTTLSQPTLSLPRLRAELGGEVIGPQDAGYDAARVVHRRTIDRRPAAIVRPVDADEVATVVSIARETGVELAIRGGAHSGAGHGVTDQGIVLDLSAMKSLQIEWESGMAWVETGLTAGVAAVVAALIDMVRSQPYPDLFGAEPQGPSIAATNTMFLDAVAEDVAASILDHLRASTAQVAAVQLRVLGGAIARVPSDATAFARQGEPGTYVNFVGDEGAARVSEAYPGRTGERLAAIKRAYDPENLFRLNQNIEPARE